MPLQIRRGTRAEANILTVPPAAGELIFITTEQKLYIGDGVKKLYNPDPAQQLSPVTGFTTEDAQDAAASLFTTTPTHSGISFAYDDLAATLTATVNLSNYVGTIRADAFKGSVFADDGSTIGGQPLVDAISGTFNGNLVGNVTGNTAGVHTGAVVGNVTGNTVGVHTGNVTGDVTGNTEGYHTGDVKGSVFADNSSLLVDSVDRIFYGTIDTGDTVINTDGLTGSIFNLGTPAAPLSLNLNLDNNLQVRQVADAASGRYLTFSQNRGTLASPTAVQAGDILGGLLIRGYTNTSSSGIVGNIAFVVDPTASVTPGSGFIKGQLVFSCASDSAVDTSKSAGLDSTGAFQVHHLDATAWIKNTVYADDAARSSAIPTPLKGMMVFMTSGTSPAVTNKLVVYDGSAWVALH